MKENKNYSVYAHIVPKELSKKDVDKIYIGITCLIPENRWRNGKGYRHNTHFYNAIKKYGWDNLKHIIIIENVSEDVAKECEKALISKYNTQNNKYGYNKTTGGDTALFGVENGFYGKHHTKETLEKIRKTKESHGKYHHSEEVKKKISEASKRMWAEKGKKFKDKMSKKTKERWNNKEFYEKMCNKKIEHKKVILLNTKELFDSIDIAQKKYNVTSIRQCCNNEITFAGRDKNGVKLVWMYYDNYINTSEKEILEKLRIGKGFDSVKAVINLDTNCIYSSAMAGSRAYGRNKGCHITECARGERQTAFKHRWDLLSHYLEVNHCSLDDLENNKKYTFVN